MTPLHPLAAVAAGTVLGLAALTAPNTVPVRGLDPEPVRHCQPHCPQPVVGSRPGPDRIQPIDSPGQFGLGQPPEGDIYAVIDDQIVRIGPDGRIRSVLRPAPQMAAR